MARINFGAETQCKHSERGGIQSRARRAAPAPLRAEKQEQRSEVEGGSERLCALGYVDHCLGLQRVQRKHGGHSHGQEVPPGRAAKPENLTREEEDQQRGGEVDGQVRRMKGKRRWPCSPVIEGKGEIGEHALAVNRVQDR